MDNSIYKIKVYIDVLKDCATAMCDDMLAVWYKWRCKTEDCSEEKAIAQCIFQMVISKVRSILVLFDGITIEPNSKNKNIVDISSIIPIIRSLYEVVWIFKCLFILPETKEEKSILLYLWQIKGLNNRQNLDYLPNEHKKKISKEGVSIEKLKKKIYDIMSKLSISEKAEKKLRRIIDKSNTEFNGFRFEKDKTNNQIVNFSKITLTSSVQYLLKENNYNILYNSLSMNTHSSYISVLQFGQRFNDRQYYLDQREHLTTVCILMAIFFTDCCKLIKEMQPYFDNLPEDNKVRFEQFRSQAV